MNIQAVPQWLCRAVLWVCFPPLCWLAMQGVHELGHIAAAQGTGGRVEQVVLHPAGISRTDVSPNPRPLAVCWAGPMVGVLAPLVGWGLFAAFRWPGVALFRFFAGFCLIANGLYLGLGSFDHIGDAGDLIRLGAPRFTLWLFGLLTVPSGLYLWHGLGPSFGLGRHPQPVSPWVSLTTLLALLLACMVLSTLFPG